MQNSSKSSTSSSTALNHTSEVSDTDENENNVSLPTTALAKSQDCNNTPYRKRELSKDLLYLIKISS